MCNHIHLFYYIWHKPSKFEIGAKVQENFHTCIFTNGFRLNYFNDPNINNQK